MKYGMFLFSLLLSNQHISAQTGNTDVKLDLLKQPSSPAAHLLNFAPNSIEKPTDLTAVWFSFNNATGKLTQLPNSYALDLSPAVLSKSKLLSLKSLQATALKDILWQTFVISTGIKQFDDTVTQKSYYKTALGFKVTLARPAWSEATLTKFNELSVIQESITNSNITIRKEVTKDSIIKNLDRKRRDALAQYGQQSAEYAVAQQQYISQFSIAFAKLSAEKNAELKAAIRKKAEGFVIERVGWYAELAGGFSAAFPTNSFTYSIADRSGAWLTGGYDGGFNKISFLGIARYLYQPETLFADSTGKLPTNKISTFDAGTRLLYVSGNSKLNISFESIYRSVLNKSIVNPSWRVLFSAAYSVGANQQLTFSFGRDFNGTLEKSGNLIAGLNFIVGLGGDKTVEK